VNQKPQTSSTKVKVSKQAKSKIKSYSILPLNQVVGLPGDTIAFNLGNKNLIKIVQNAHQTDQIIFTTCKTQLKSKNDLGLFGVLATISEINQKEKGKFKFKLKFSKRVELTDISKRAGISKGTIVEIKRKPNIKTQELNAWQEEIQQIIGDISKHKDTHNLNGNFEIDVFDNYISDVARKLDFKHEDRLLFIDGWGVKRRVFQLIEVLSKMLATLKIRQQIREKTSAKINRIERHAFLQEEKKVIEGELGDKNKPSVPSEYKELSELITKAVIPLSIKESIDKEFTKLCRSGIHSPHSATLYDYIETVIALPWDSYAETQADWKVVEKSLNDSHFGLQKVKDRVLRYLAVHHLSKKPQGSIICLVGPPGVGKTSFARAIASALELPFIKKSLGGVRDESEIRGHRRTYVGSMPGRIMQGIKKAGVSNPVFLLDEVDKLSEDHKGNPADALLEVLDIEENKNFSDHYLEVEYDLSKVFWILTANNENSIPFALRDRLEIIDFNSYTIDEKAHIASEYLIQKNLKKQNLGTYNVDISQDILRKIILSYTRESGVRELDRKINTLIQQLALNHLRKKKASKSWKVTMPLLKKTLGNTEIKRPKWVKSTWAPGVMAGLAWTMHGGTILKMECSLSPGSGKLLLTGKMGEVMKESAHAAFSFIKNNMANFKLTKDDFAKNDFHIHMPAGAVSKEGPSAGLGLTLLLYSAIKKITPKPFWAVTGEISLHGKVLPIGGLKEKVLAAEQEGFSGVVLPKQNKQEILEIPKHEIEHIQIIYVTTFQDAFKIFFNDRDLK
jgi:ATP-dependent Lon protease